MKKKRGRPRKFDREIVLTKAMNLFWKKGFSSTSLDDLSTEMNMSRPSIYNAFGSKESVYCKSFELYVSLLGKRLTDDLFSDENIKIALKSFYSTILETHFHNNKRLGCFIISTSPVETVLHPKIKKCLSSNIKNTNDLLVKRLNQETGNLKKSSCRAKILQAILHSGSIRARCGESKESVKNFYFDTVDALFSEN